LLKEALARGATIVPASRRLAHMLKAEDARAHRDAGDEVWESPDILPWSAWLARSLGAQAAGALQDRGGRAWALLDDAEAAVLWESIIAAAGEDQPLLQRSATARAALEAWALCRAWGISLDELAHSEHEEVRLFAGWSDAYMTECEARGWVDRARLPALVGAMLDEAALAPPEELVLAGFDEFNPAEEQVVAALERARVRVGHWQPEPCRCQASRLACADRAAEIECAAHWVRARLMHDPNCRIGVVAPDLAERGAEIVRIFDAVLRPAASIAGTDASAAPYNISLGQALSAQPLVRDALLALELGRERVSFDIVSALLRSPFLEAAEAERNARALLEARLRETGEISIRAAWLVRIAEREAFACPRLAAALKRARRVLNDGPARRRPSVWAVSLDRFLAALGWPGERTLTSAEYQALAAWREVLTQLARLDRVLPAIEIGAAIMQLGRLARERLFQPQSPMTPVQVLGLLETAGLEFDALWLMGLTDAVWPPAPRPNPFIPAALQRRLGMPHASAERELAFAERLTERLLTSAPEAIASWPEREADRPLRPSPLIAALPPAEDFTATENLNYAETLRASAKIESFTDAAGPPLAGDVAHGGTGLIKLQAACPFRAFAVHRLGARALPVSKLGLSPSERGKLVHRVLERLWGELGDQAHLAALTAPERAELVAGHVAAVTAEAQRRAPAHWSAGFSRLESGRLERLVDGWLGVELNRPPFEVVECEAEHTLAIGGLSLRTRVDRIDALTGGGVAVIDYKTGKISVNDWLGEQPNEPQLPLYAMNGGNTVRAVLFANLRPGKLEYVGLAAEDNAPPGAKVETDWPARLAGWRSALTKLAEAFRAGEARVAPKQGGQTCRLCHLHGLCRVHELTDMVHDGGDSGE
jgi:probable DNA repair protein